MLNIRDESLTVICKAIERSEHEEMLKKKNEVQVELPIAEDVEMERKHKQEKQKKKKEKKMLEESKKADEEEGSSDSDDLVAPLEVSDSEEEDAE